MYSSPSHYTKTLYSPRSPTICIQAQPFNLTRAREDDYWHGEGDEFQV